MLFLVFKFGEVVLVAVQVAFFPSSSASVMQVTTKSVVLVVAISGQ
jgi:hypothetical protein